MNQNSKDSLSSQDLESQWFQAAYVSAKKFYERDNVLDSKDRLELSKAYRSISNAQLWGGWLGFSSIFLPPFVFKFYKTNKIKGVNVTKSFVFGIIGMIISTKVAGDQMYSNIMNRLATADSMNSTSKYDDNDGQFQEHIPHMETSEQRQLNMLKLLNNGGSRKWAAYFYITHDNPQRRFPNPETKLEELKRGETQKGSFLNQRDPMGLYSGISKEDKQGVPEIKKDSSSSSLSSWDRVRQDSDANGSSWDRLRLGLNDSANETDPANKHKDDDDPFFIPEQPSQTEFDTLLQKEREVRDDYN